MTMNSPAPRRRRLTLRGFVWIVIVLAVLGTIAWLVLRPREVLQAGGAAGGGRHGGARSGGSTGSGGGRFGGDEAMPVVAATIATADIPINYNGLGTVVPFATVTVHTRIAGQLISVGFTEGQDVKQGDTLADVDPRPYQAALAQAQGTLVHDQALLADARLDLARYKILVAQDSIARQTLDTQKSLVDQYIGTVKSDEGNVETARLNLEYCHITSPISGRAGLRQVDPGNYVQTSDTNGLVILTQLQPISVEFTLPEDDLPLIRKRMAGGTTLPVVVHDRSGATLLATGTLLTTDNQIDTTTGTIKLRANFENKDESLFPNQFVNATLTADTLHGVVAAPVAALQHGSPGDFVYLIKPDDTVTVRVVKLGISSGQYTEIKSGLAAGDRVVIDGTDRLKEGAKIVIPPANAQNGTAPTNGTAPATGDRSGDQEDNAAHKHHRKNTDGNSAPAQ